MEHIKSNLFSTNQVLEVKLYLCGAEELLKFLYSHVNQLQKKKLNSLLKSAVYTIINFTVAQLPQVCCLSNEMCHSLHYICKLFNSKSFLNAVMLQPV